jgi:hypothetical protein
MSGSIIPPNMQFWYAIQTGYVSEWRSESYLAYVRNLPCAVTQKTRGVTAHHLVGHGLKGNGEKTSDMLTFPLVYDLHLPMYPEGLHQLGHEEWEKRFGDQRLFVFQTLVRAIYDGILTC